MEARSFEQARLRTYVTDLPGPTPVPDGHVLQVENPPSALLVPNNYYMEDDACIPARWTAGVLETDIHLYLGMSISEGERVWNGAESACFWPSQAWPW
jgi:hypothetical protein